MGNTMICDNNGTFCQFFNKGCYSNLLYFDNILYNNLSITFFNNYCLEAFSDNNCKGSKSLKYCTNTTNFFYPDWNIKSFSCFSNKKGQSLQTFDIIGIVLLSICALFIIFMIFVGTFKLYKFLAKSLYNSNNTNNTNNTNQNSQFINQDA